MLEAYIDGCCEPNPGGTASYGVIIRKSKDSLPEITEGLMGEGMASVGIGSPSVWESSGVVGTGPGMSNNVAEYAALIKLLEWFDENLLPDQQVRVLSDSQLLVKQMSLEWAAKSSRLYYSYYQRAIHLMLTDKFKSQIEFQWIPRESNLADRLAVEALAKVGIVRRRS